MQTNDLESRTGRPARATGALIATSSAQLSLTREEGMGSQNFAVSRQLVAKILRAKRANQLPNGVPGAGRLHRPLPRARIPRLVMRDS